MLKPLAASIGAIFTGACALGFTPFVEAVAAVGAGFLINDRILVPLFAVFLGLTIWLLWVSGRRHKYLGPFLLGATSAATAFGALWFFPPLAYAALIALFGACVWDLLLGPEHPPTPQA